MTEQQKVYANELCAQISKITDVDPVDVMKVLCAIGLERRLEDAGDFVSKTPSLQEVFVGFCINRSTLAV